MRTHVLWIVAATLLGGCASVVPQAIRGAAPGDVRLAQVREQPQQYHGTVVRWGGDIVSTRNERDDTVIEIIARDLNGDGRPLEGDESPGRFLVKVRGFLDPSIYKPERQLTVRGRIEGVVTRAIGEYRYTYPLVQADDVYLWKPLPPASARPRYPYYDPFFYDPWYPWGWPYYRPWPYYPQ
ncbi:MAG: Slp family lipoprotein [Sulfuricaulis sp.]